MSKISYCFNSTDATTTTTNHTESCFTDSATSNLQYNDDITDEKIEDSKSRRSVYSLQLIASCILLKAYTCMYINYIVKYCL